MSSAPEDPHPFHVADLSHEELVQYLHDTTIVYAMASGGQRSLTATNLHAARAELLHRLHDSEPTDTPDLDDDTEEADET